MGKKNLYVEQPLLSSYSQHALIWNILSKEKKDLCWFAMYYIHLAMQTKEAHIINYAYAYNLYLAMRECYLLETNCFNRTLILAKFSSFTSFAEDCIDAGYYLYYVNNRDALKISQSSGYHEIMIYGYDRQAQTFLTGEYFKDTKYSYESVSYKEIEQGFQNIPEQCDVLFGVHLLKRNPAYSTALNLKVVISQLDAYLNSKNDSLSVPIYSFMNSFDMTYGMDIYKLQIDILQNSTGEEIELKNMFLIHEHKCLIEFLLTELEQHDLLPHSYIKRYQEVKDLTQRNLLLSIKYNLTRSNKITDSIINNIKSFAGIEKNILDDVVRDLKAGGSDYKL